DCVNMVNALAVDKERDIDIVETRHDSEGDYNTFIKVTVTTDKQVRCVAGTLFADKRPRIVSVKDIAVDAELTPNMLYVSNEDLPGFIGALGTTLGEAGLNIATFSLGRASEGGEAIALVAIDAPADAATVAAVESLPHVKQVKALTF
ncbi:MAG: ACT domain-containing protein, partial [Emcibacter sp.]|nr:ACT domain-containing protein [Emcibacter sp.]